MSRCAKNLCPTLAKDLQAAWCPHKQHRQHLQDGNIAIVMEYMDGGPLCGLVRQCRVLQEPVLAEVTRQTLQVGTPILLHSEPCMPRPAAELL